MSEKQRREKLKDAFQKWAAQVKEPDAPVLGFYGTKVFSAKELAQEVANDTDVGQSVIEVLEHGARKEGIDKVIERLTGKNNLSAKKNSPKP